MLGAFTHTHDLSLEDTYVLPPLADISQRLVDARLWPL